MEQSLVFCATVTRDYFSKGKPTAIGTLIV